MLRGRIVAPLACLIGLAGPTVLDLRVPGVPGMPGTGEACAQPVDPYQPSPAPVPGPPAPGPAPAPAPDAPTPGPAPTAPQDPYEPAAAAPPASVPAAPQSSAPVAIPAHDPVLAERVAAALVVRAQELLEARSLLDAKQLAVEALVQSPRGAAAETARAIIARVNQELGIAIDTGRPDPLRPLVKPDEDVDLSPIQDPTSARISIAPPPEGRGRRTRLADRVHGGLYLGLVGTAIGSLASGDNPAAGAVPAGLAAGLGGALVAPLAVDRLRWSEPQVRLVGSATIWGGVVGGLFGDIARTEGTTASEVLATAAAGSTLTGLAAVALARTSKLTRGDVAMVDTFAGIGAVGGLTAGMLMQPVQDEAYSLNSVVGVTAGVTVALLAAQRIDATPARMARVAGLSAVGAIAPFLLYAVIYSQDSTADERLTGALSTGGLVVGAYLGFRWTRGLDAGRDQLGQRAVEDAPAALIGRSSDGSWRMGGVGVQPLSRTLAPQPGMALQVIGAAF